MENNYTFVSPSVIEHDMQRIDENGTYISAIHSIHDSAVDFKDQFCCDNHGTEYYNKTQGIHIIIPHGAVPEGVTLTIEVGIMLNGPFIFPDKTKVVSPVLWVCFADYLTFQLQKPVSITLPHFLDLSFDSDIALLRPHFMKASHGLKQSEQFIFHPMDQSEAIFPSKCSSATVKTKHFCYCIFTE